MRVLLSLLLLLVVRGGDGGDTIDCGGDSSFFVLNLLQTLLVHQTKNDYTNVMRR